MISLKRAREWVGVMVGPRVRFRDWWKIVRGMSHLLLSGSVRRVEWRRRMRTCYLCPVFNPEKKICRPFAESEMGCGCYTPYSNLVNNGKCWGRGAFGENFGW